MPHFYFQQQLTPQLEPKVNNVMPLKFQVYTMICGYTDSQYTQWEDV